MRALEAGPMAERVEREVLFPGLACSSPSRGGWSTLETGVESDFGFFNSEVALGYWSGTVLVEGLAGKTLSWLGVASFFLLGAAKLEIKKKSNSLLQPQERVGSKLSLFSHIYIYIYSSEFYFLTTIARESPACI